MDDKPGTLTLMVGSMLAEIFILGIIAILSDLFDGSTTSKGRLLARKERYFIERTEHYERKVEHQYAEFVKSEIFEPHSLPSSFSLATLTSSDQFQASFFAMLFRASIFASLIRLVSSKG